MGATSLRESLRVLEQMRTRVVCLKDNAVELALVERAIVDVQCELARCELASSMRRYVKRGLRAYELRSRG